MDTNKEQLMKHFATVLRNRALGKKTETQTGRNLPFYFSRKELIEILKKKFQGSIPKEHNLAELEKQEILDIVGDELFIISYVTEKWSREPKEIKPEKPKTGTPPKTEASKTSQNKKKDDNTVSK